ncbi:MAG: glycoside hydrolase domain-containing protein, partial [Promethearchaeota archaeon]
SFIILIILTPVALIVPQNIRARQVPLLAANTSSNIAIWSCFQDTKVDKDFVPIFSEIKNDSGVGINFMGAKNDHEYAQIVISPLRSNSIMSSINRLLRRDEPSFPVPRSFITYLKSANSSGTTGTDDTRIVLLFNVSDFVLENNYNINISSNNFKIGKIDYVLNDFPDKIVPIVTNNREPVYDELVGLTLDADRNYPLWLSLYIPSSAKAGDYHANLTIYATLLGDHQSTTELAGDVYKISTLNINVHVYNFTIPVRRSTRSAFKPSTYDRRYVDNYNAHRLDISGSRPDFEVNSSTHEVIFNWTRWDQDVQYNLDHGARAFEVSLGSTSKITEEYNITATSYYSQLEQHLKAKGWLEYAYIYIWDEPSPSDYPIIHQLAQIYKAAAPDIKILLTINPDKGNEMIWDDIDIWVPIEHAIPKSMNYIRQRQVAGDEVWYYVCLFPKVPYANIQANSLLIETRILGWNIFRFDLDGILYWHTTAYYHGAYGLGYNGLLDGWLLYQSDKNATFPFLNSTRWDILGDGMEDFEYFVILQNLTQELSQNSPNNTQTLNLVSQSNNLLNEINELIPNWTDYSRDVESYYKLRQEICTQIENILAYLN